MQADLLQLPFPYQMFEFIYCFGVLHHMPNANAALMELVDYLKGGGQLRIYVYWDLNEAPRWKQLLLGLVRAARRVTTQLPHRPLW